MRIRLIQGGVLHTGCNTPPCVMVARLIQGGVLYPAVPDYEFRCASTDTRMPFECHSNAPKPKLECPKTKSECIRRRGNHYSDIGKRHPNAFAHAETKIRISENEIRMHSKTRKPLFGYRKTNIRVYIWMLLHRIRTYCYGR